eukprot:m.292788 g.292788  ORF g.292788 m.292788 type:complete len:1973 (+) comp17829_c0_seq1:255-6173(+)
MRTLWIIASLLVVALSSSVNDDGTKVDNNPLMLNTSLSRERRTTYSPCPSEMCSCSVCSSRTISGTTYYRCGFCLCNNGYQKTGLHLQPVCSDCLDDQTNRFFEASKSDVRCEKCATGKAESFGTCSDCSNGKYQDQTGQQSCKTCDPTRCNKGRGLSGCGGASSGTCPKCSPGKYELNNICTTCESGKYQSQSGAIKCNNCGGCRFDGDHRVGCGGSDEGQCMDCPRGKYEKFDECLSCQAGKYTDNTGQTNCKQCQTGKASNAIGATSSNTCVSCSKGYFQPQFGQATCDPCPVGKYMDQTGRTWCRQCSSGKYSNITAATDSSDCQVCAKGSYQSQPEQASCILCEVGKYLDSTGGTGGCKQCPAGKYMDQRGADDLSDCKACPDGQFQHTPGQTSCQQCPVGKRGTTSTAKDREGDACARCPRGKYQDQPGQMTCSPCQAGTYSNDEVQTTCKTCQAGKYQNQTSQTSCLTCNPASCGDGVELQLCQGASGGTCKTCPAGKIRSGTQQTCQACAPGTFQNQEGKSICVLCGCPVGQESAGCGGNQAGSCTTCQAGTYKLGTGDDPCQSCQPCNPGSYSTCQAPSSQGSCEKCSAGKYQNKTGYITSCTACKACPHGHVRIGCGEGSAGVCQQCLDSYIAPTSTYQDTCRPCDTCAPGLGLSLCGGTSPGVCTACPNTEFSATNSSDGCEPKQLCGAGQFAIDHGQVRDIDCESCGIGSFQSKTTHRNAECELCPINTYSNESKSTSCYDCPRIAGQYTEGPGARGCATCPEGTRLIGETNRSCELCQAGSFSSAGSTVCLTCVAGKFSDVNGSSECPFCPEGYRSAAGSQQCDPCPAGTKGTLQRSHCDQCPPGQFQPHEGQAECIKCPTGFTVTNGFQECRDLQPPVILLDPNTHIQEANLPFSYRNATASDSSGMAVHLNHTFNVNPDVPGVYHVIYTAVDAAGNNASESYTVEIVAAGAPIIRLYNPAARLRIAVFALYRSGGGSITDLVDGDLSHLLKSNADSVNTSVVTVYTVTYWMNGTDSQGLTAFNITQEVEIFDNVNPRLELLGPTVAIVEATSTWVDPGFIATDNYDGNITSSVEFFPQTIDTKVSNGTTVMVRYDVIDSSGNPQSAQRTVVIVDRTPPTLQLLGNASVVLAADTPFDDLGATAFDTLDGNVNVEPGFPVNTDITQPSVTFVITYTAVDNAGNRASITRTVQVVDAPPTLNLTGASRINVPYGTVYRDPGVVAHDVRDGDLSAAVIFNISTIDVFQSRLYLLTYTVTDVVFNVAVASRSIFVEPFSTPSDAFVLTIELADDIEEVPSSRDLVKALNPRVGGFTFILSRYSSDRANRYNEVASISSQRARRAVGTTLDIAARDGQSLEWIPNSELLDRLEGVEGLVVILSPAVVTTAREADVPASKAKKSQGMALGLGIAAAAVFVILVAVVIVYRRRDVKKESSFATTENPVYRSNGAIVRHESAAHMLALQHMQPRVRTSTMTSGQYVLPEDDTPSNGKQNMYVGIPEDDGYQEPVVGQQEAYYESQVDAPFAEYTEPVLGQTDAYYESKMQPAEYSEIDAMGSVSFGFGSGSGDDAYGIPSAAPVNNDVYDQPNPPPSTYAVPSTGEQGSSVYAVPSKPKLANEDVYDQPNPPPATYAAPGASDEVQYEVAPKSAPRVELYAPVESTVVDDTYETAPAAQPSVQLYAPLDAPGSTSEEGMMQLDPHASNPILLLSDGGGNDSTVDRRKGYNDHVLSLDATAALPTARGSARPGSDETLRTQARTHPAFKGLLSRRDTTNALSNKPVGTFLLRVSGTVDSTVLSFKTPGRLQHSTLTQESEGVRVDKSLLVRCSSIHEAIVQLIQQDLLGLRYFLNADDALMPVAALVIPEPFEMSRKEAEDAIQYAPEGTFVLRKRKGPSSWALSHTSKGKMSHHLIAYNEAEKVYMLNSKQRLKGASVVEAIHPLFLAVGSGLTGLLVASVPAKE